MGVKYEASKCSEVADWQMPNHIIQTLNLLLVYRQCSF